MKHKTVSTADRQLQCKPLSQCQTMQQCTIIMRITNS